MLITARVPDKLTLVITHSCNQSCEFCFDASNILARPLAEHMTLDTVDAMLARLRQTVHNVNTFNITLSGGEPSVHPDFLEIVRRVSEAGFSVTILSNGQRFADREFMAEVLRHRIWNLQFSIEGSCPETHDRRVGCRGAWARTVQAIRNAQACGVRYITNTTMTRSSIADMFAVIDLLDGLGVPKMNIGNTLPECAGRNYSVLMEYPEVVDVAERLTLYAMTKRIGFSFITPLPFCLKDGRVISNPSVCSAGRYSMVVNVDGTFGPCSVCQPPSELLPRVSSELDYSDVPRVLDAVVASHVRSDVPAECKACSRLSECRAGCPLYWKVPLVATPADWRARGLMEAGSVT